MGFHLIDDWDFPFHLKTGAKILESGVPREDLYSFRTTGRTWLDAQWLFQVLVYLAYRSFGFKGLSFLLAGLVVLTWMIFGSIGQARKTCFFVFPVSLLALWGAAHRIYLRPELFSYLLVAIYMLLLERERKKRIKLLMLLPVLSIFWANVEGLWPLGLVLLGSYFGEELWLKYFAGSARLAEFGDERTRPRPLRMLAVLIVCLAAGFATPYFAKGFLFPLTLVQETIGHTNYIKTHIEEELSPFPYFRFPFVEIPFLILACLSLASLALNYKKFRSGHWLLFIAFLFLGLNARRNMAFLCLVAIPIVGLNLQAWLARHPRREYIFKAISTMLGLALAIFLLVSVPSGKFFAWDQTHRKLGAGIVYSNFPYAAAEFLKGNNWTGNIFNQLHQGGFLIAVRKPGWKIYVDGRTEVYGGELIEESFRALKDYSFFLAEQKKWGFDAALIDRRDPMATPLLKAITSDPAWALVYRDQFFLLFLLNIPSNQPIIFGVRP